MSDADAFEALRAWEQAYTPAPRLVEVAVPVVDCVVVEPRMWSISDYHEDIIKHVIHGAGSVNRRMGRAVASGDEVKAMWHWSDHNRRLGERNPVWDFSPLGGALESGS